MTTPQPLTKDMIWFVKDRHLFLRSEVWLAAQWLRQGICYCREKKELGLGTCGHCLALDRAFGACRPETDVEKALSGAKERIKRYDCGHFHVNQKPCETYEKEVKP